MKTALSFLIIATFLFSCVHKSDVIKQEKGIVVAKQYSPSINATGTGINTNGDLSFHSLNADEKFNVVFKCQHGNVFTVNNPDVYAKLSTNDSVNIYYQELLVDNKVVDYDFVTATIK